MHSIKPLLMTAAAVLASTQTVKTDNASKGRKRIAFVGFDIGLIKAFVLGNAAGIIMFDNNSCRSFEFTDDINRGIQIKDIIKRQFLALQLLQAWPSPSCWALSL